jgi:hypothetical protein
MSLATRRCSKCGKLPVPRLLAACSTQRHATRAARPAHRRGHHQGLRDGGSADPQFREAPPSLLPRGARVPRLRVARGHRRRRGPPLRGWCGAQPRAGLLTLGVTAQGAGVDRNLAIGPEPPVCSPYGCHMLASTQSPAQDGYEYRTRSGLRRREGRRVAACRDVNPSDGLRSREISSGLQRRWDD